MRMRRKITRSGGRQRRGGANRVLIRCAWRRSLHWNVRVIGRQSLDQNWLYLQSYYHRSPFWLHFCFDDAGDFCIDHLVDKEVPVDFCQGERTRDAQRSWSPAHGYLDRLAFINRRHRHHHCMSWRHHFHDGHQFHDKTADLQEWGDVRGFVAPFAWVREVATPGRNCVRALKRCHREMKKWHMMRKDLQSQKKTKKTWQLMKTISDDKTW